MISFSLTDRQISLKAEVRHLATEALNPIQKGSEDTLEPVYTKWKLAGEYGLPGLSIPEEYGGKGLDPLDTFLILEELGYASTDNGFNFGICAHLLACAVPVNLYGSEHLKKTYLPDACLGLRIIGNAMSEPASGSDAFRMETTAETTPTGYAISGHKNFVSNLEECQLILLYARTQSGSGAMGGISAFLLDTAMHRVIKGAPLDKAGLSSCTLGGIFLDQTPVDQTFLVGSEGRGAMIFNKSMEWERAILGAIHLGNCRRLLEQATSALRSRRDQNGQDQQHKAFKLAEWHTQWDAAFSLACKSAWRMKEGKNAIKEASMTKWYISELYRQITSGLITIFGNEYPDAEDLSRSFCDAASSTIYSGTSEIQKLIISQQLGI
jgi:alkylation response protein AidB-like acyl-CoA dehydrogenase